MVSLAAVQVVTAASATLVSLYFAETGESQAVAAAAPAFYSLGFLLGCFFAAGPIASVGYIRSFAAAAAISAASALLFSLTENVPALLAVRLFTGVATAVLFAIGDSWVNEAADGSSRGRLLAIYAVIMGLMSVASQLVIMFVPEDLNKSFVLVSLLYCFAIVVIAGTRTNPPEIKSSAAVRIGALFKESPTGMVGAFTVGAVQTALLSIVPYRLAIFDFDSLEIALLVGSLYLGRILFQFPIGKASDGMDRRVVILVLSCVATTCFLVLSIMGTGDGTAFRELEDMYTITPVLVFSILLGACFLTLYSVLVAHALDRTPPVFVSASAITMLLAYTIGSVIGPLIVSVGSEFFGDMTLGWFSFGAMTIFSAFVAYRIKTVVPVSKAEKSATVVVPQNSVELAPTTKRKDTIVQADTSEREIEETEKKE